MYVIRNLNLKNRATFGLFIGKFTKPHSSLFLLFFHKNKNLLNQSFIVFKIKPNDEKNLNLLVYHKSLDKNKFGIRFS